MMQYTYFVGQMVRTAGRFPSQSGARMYQIVRLLPPTAGDDVPRYRVRSVPDGVEWVVAQDRLKVIVFD
jgi:hypothetical protein